MKTHKKKLSFQSRFKTFKLGFEGFGNLIEFEPNVWFDLAATLIVIIAGVEFGLSSLEWIVVVLTIGFVLAVGAPSFAIEILSLVPNPATTPFSDVAKSLSATAILLANIMAFIIGLIIFIPKLFPTT